MMETVHEPSTTSSKWRRVIDDLRDRFGIWTLVAAVAFIQTAILGYMIWDRAMLLKNGREVVVDVVPVDPRSLFRGDYVILNYQLSVVDKNLATFEPKRRDQVFVTLQKEAGAKGWQPIRIEREKPEALAAEQVLVRANVQGFTSRSVEGSKDRVQQVRLRYGAESYFVEEGKGKELEKQIADRKIQVLWAVAPSGEVAVKALLINGQKLYEEPLL